MLFIEDLKSLFLYSNKRKMFIPINEKDKRHGSAIFLMSPSKELNEKMMNAPFIHSPQNLFRSYYIDRNVMTYVNSEANNTIEEDFDEVQEAALSEGMLHPNDTKFIFENTSTMDERILKDIFNKKALKYYLSILKVSDKDFNIESIKVICHSNLSHLKASAPFNTKEQFYSFTNKNEINLLSKLVYDENSMDGPYDLYCKHELIYCILNHLYHNAPKKILTCSSMAVSGQIKWLRDKKSKEEFKYSDSKKEAIRDLYLADCIHQLFEDRGAYGLHKLLSGDVNVLRSIVGARIIRDTKKLFGESTITSSLNESDTKTDDIPGLEYGKNFAMAGDHSDDYYAVLHILDTFSKKEFDIVSFNPTYVDSKYIKKRIVLRDNNGIPMSFMDVYNFPSDPERAQITTGVSKFYRGHHLCSIMLEKLFNSGFAIENGIKKYIWHVHPGNDRSESIAKKAGFIKTYDNLDKYGRMTYVYNVDDSYEEEKITTPEVNNESGLVLNESAIMIYEDTDTSNYNARIKKYLYKERLKNAREILPMYEQIKSRNPMIDRTYRDLKFYKGLNVYVDTSYYHDLYLKNVIKNRDRKTMNMYFDFLNRLMDSSRFKDYSKFTYFFSIHSRSGQSVDDLMNWNISLNPISAICYFAMKEADVLKRWKDKNIIFIGDNGYFSVNFDTFSHANLTKFKRNVAKLYSNAPIEDEDTEEANKYKAASVEVLDKVAGHLGVNDVSAISNININHLSIEDTMPKLIDKNNSTAIMILGVDSNAVISEINSKALKNKDIKVYYKPKV